MHATPKVTRKVQKLAAESYETDDIGRIRVKRSIIRDNPYGCYRVVIVEDNVAYKLIRNPDEVAVNRFEWRFWYSLPAGLRRLTAKPLAISNCGKVVAFEYVPEILASAGYKWEEEKRIQSSFNSKLCALLRDNGFSDHEIELLTLDNHCGNIGVRPNGELVWLDFCSPEVLHAKNLENLPQY